MSYGYHGYAGRLATVAGLMTPNETGVPEARQHERTKWESFGILLLLLLLSSSEHERTRNERYGGGPKTPKKHKRQNGCGEVVRRTSCSLAQITDKMTTRERARERVSVALVVCYI